MKNKLENGTFQEKKTLDEKNLNKSEEKVKGGNKENAQCRKNNRTKALSREKTIR